VEQAVEQPLHTTESADQPQPHATSPVPAAARSAEQAAPAAPTQSEAPAASTLAVTPVRAPAPHKEARSQQQQPVQKKSKKTRSAVSPTTQHITRPPLQSISNTATRYPSTGLKTSARNVKPVWGAHIIGPYLRPAWGAQGGALDARQARAGRTPHMLPNGQVEFF
jgi:hypothetical protein